VTPRGLAACCAALALAHCTSTGGPAPLARLDLSPAHIPEADGFATPVLLDGRRSLPAEGEDASDLRWAVRILDTDDGYLVAPAEEQPDGCAAHMLAPCVLVRFRGDHPVVVELSVTSGGRSSTARRTVALTVD